ncbi:hypothetical protein ACIRL0_01415 [Streptomyces sp. NPDC102365]|uniref:hypothetical protein n=1 Tax=Streptomyces sp. NPDC102365 TaxID=3366162 RepID=UPI003824A95E
MGAQPGREDRAGGGGGAFALGFRRLRWCGLSLPEPLDVTGDDLRPGWFAVAS